MRALEICMPHLKKNLYQLISFLKEAFSKIKSHRSRFGRLTIYKHDTKLFNERLFSEDRKGLYGSNCYRYFFIDSLYIN